MDSHLDISCIRAICFDLDGTLSDTDDVFVRRLAGWLRIFRFAFPNRDPLPFARRVVMSTESPGTFLYGLPDRFGLDDEISAAGNLLYQLGISGARQPYLLVPGVREMLEALHPYYPLSIISARGARTASAFLNQFELAPYFKCVVTSQTCPHTKPFPDPVHYAARQMGVPASDCIMIGDTTVDILAGKAAGAQTAGVLCGFGEHRELQAAGANTILSTTADVTKLLLDSSSI
jgi:phosphoglycolate phosphatase-like HAD superfamily hydrolase